MRLAEGDQVQADADVVGPVLNPGTDVRGLDLVRSARAESGDDETAVLARERLAPRHAQRAASGPRTQAPGLGRHADANARACCVRTLDDERQHDVAPERPGFPMMQISSYPRQCLRREGSGA